MSDDQNYPSFTVKLATDNQLVGMSKRYSYNKDGSGMMQEEANELGITYNDSLQLAILIALRTYQGAVYSNSSNRLIAQEWSR